MLHIKNIILILAIFTPASLLAVNYHFTYEADKRDRNCCSATATFSDLGEEGMNLGIAKLPIEDRTFRYQGRFGEYNVKLKTSIDSKVAGDLTMDFRFLCDPTINRACPESGEVFFSVSFPIDCGLRKTKKYVGKIRQDTTELLNQVILGNPESVLMEGYVDAYIVNQTKCKASR